MAYYNKAAREADMAKLSDEDMRIITDIANRFHNMTVAYKETILSENKRLYLGLSTLITDKFNQYTPEDKNGYLMALNVEFKEAKKLYPALPNKPTEVLLYMEALDADLMDLLFADNDQLDNMAAAWKEMMSVGPHLQQLYMETCMSLVVNLANITPFRKEITILLPSTFIREGRMNTLIEFKADLSGASELTGDSSYSYNPTTTVIQPTVTNVSTMGLFHMGQYLHYACMDGTLPTDEEIKRRGKTPTEAEMKMFNKMRVASPDGPATGPYVGWKIPMFRVGNGPNSAFLEYWNTAHYLCGPQNPFLTAESMYIAHCILETPLREQWKLLNFRDDFGDGSKRHEKAVTLAKVNPSYHRAARMHNLHTIDADHKAAQKELGGAEAALLEKGLKMANLPPGVELSDDEDEKRGQSSTKTRGQVRVKGDRKRVKTENARVGSDE